MYINNLGLNIPKELQESAPVVNESQQLGKNDFMKLLLAEMQNQNPHTTKKKHFPEQWRYKLIHTNINTYQ